MTGVSGATREAEYMLDVVRHASRIAVAPLGEDFEAIGEMPVDQFDWTADDACLLGHFAHGGGSERLARLPGCR